MLGQYSSHRRGRPAFRLKTVGLFYGLSDIGGRTIKEARARNVSRLLPVNRPRCEVNPSRTTREYNRRQARIAAVHKP